MKRNEGIAAVGLAVLFIAALAFADGEKKQLGKDDFVSNTISDVFDKLGKYSSGEKGIIDPDYDAEETDGWGRKIKRYGPKKEKRSALDEKIDESAPPEGKF